MARKNIKQIIILYSFSANSIVHKNEQKVLVSFRSPLFAGTTLFSPFLKQLGIYSTRLEL